MKNKIDQWIYEKRRGEQSAAGRVCDAESLD